MMSLMNAYEADPYGSDLARAAYEQIADRLPAVACPACPG
jgi:hypothetical protein